MYLSFSVLTENLDSSLLRLKSKQNQPRHSVGGGGGPVNTVMSGFDEEVADVMAVAVTGGGRGVYVLRQSRVYVVPKLHVT